jgi:hypothetical protein
LRLVNEPALADKWRCLLFEVVALQNGKPTEHRQWRAARRRLLRALEQP